ncbi:3947_t:CDS:1, partial [Funneliformis geosporum]
GGLNNSNEALYNTFSNTFNFFNENFDDISLYNNLLNNDVNFLPDFELLPLNSNINDIQYFEPLNDVSDYDIPTFELLNDILYYQYNLT